MRVEPQQVEAGFLGVVACAVGGFALELGIRADDRQGLRLRVLRQRQLEVSALELGGEGVQSLLSAVTATGQPTQHFVYTSVYGASSSAPVPFLAAKGASEAQIAAARGDYESGPFTEAEKRSPKSLPRVRSNVVC